MSLARQRELVVLATLHAHPMHGYALVEVLGAGLGPAVDLKPPTVYAILKRFEERGWILGELEPQGALPARTVFSVTAQGAEALPGLALAAAQDAGPAPLPLAVAIAHLDQVPLKARPPILQALLEARRARLAALMRWAGHPGLLGTAFDLLARQVQLEVEVLEALQGGKGLA